LSHLNYSRVGDIYSVILNQLRRFTVRGIPLVGALHWFLAVELIICIVYDRPLHVQLYVFMSHLGIQFLVHIGKNSGHNFIAKDSKNKFHEIDIIFIKFIRITEFKYNFF
jgi:hypothetical protein